MTPEPMIEAVRLNRRYGDLWAVRDLDLSVPRGELFCFLGPNGAGKTTTIKMMTGLLRPTSGSVRIGGIDMEADPLAAKRLIGYIPDMPFLYERLTAAEFFRFTGDLYAIPPERVARELDASFELFGLEPYRSALVKELSHGYRQRLAYAACFLHEPQVLFIDEPLVGLDPKTIRLIKDLLKEKARGGMTILLTTHILAMAQDVADRIGIISEGRLVALGTFAELGQQSGNSGSLEDVFLALTSGPE